MNNYVPFLKSKRNEIIALGELDEDVAASVIPFFDFPKSQKETTCEQFISDVTRLSKSIKKHLSKIDEIYIDTFDFDSEYEINGRHSYYYLIGSILEKNVVPVVSIDRSEEHISAVIDLCEEGVVNSEAVALRFTPEDFLSYDVVEEEIDDLLGDVFELFTNVDVIFDCRVCSLLDVSQISQNIVDFYNSISRDYSVRRVIITGSSIPASVGEILPVNNERTVQRKEIDIYKSVAELVEVIFGDYATVSPNYSEVNIAPEMMQNVMTAKLTYSYENNHFFVRGAGIKTNGRRQYSDLARTLCLKPFFRGAGYSSGDKFFDEKSRGEGSDCMPGTVVKPSINAHITYIVRDAAF